MALQLLHEQEADDVAIVDKFWDTVKTNLQASKLRLLFVADEIPPELRRNIEFLNAQMHTIEVLGVEVKQYVNGAMKTLVPRVIGQTAEAEKKKSMGGRETRQWDEASFLDVLRDNYGEGSGGQTLNTSRHTTPAALRWSRPRPGMCVTTRIASSATAAPTSARRLASVACLSFQCAIHSGCSNSNWK